jgi:hypothetical protein
MKSLKRIAQVTIALTAVIAAIAGSVGAASAGGIVFPPSGNRYSTNTGIVFPPSGN